MRVKAVLLVISMVFTSLTQGQATIDSSRIIKVLSFNILHGATVNNDFDLDIILYRTLFENTAFGGKNWGLG